MAKRLKSMHVTDKADAFSTAGNEKGCKEFFFFFFLMLTNVIVTR